MKEFNSNEILKIISTIENSRDLNHTDYESILEKYLYLFSKSLLKIKEQRAGSTQQKNETIVLLLNRILHTLNASQNIKMDFSFSPELKNFYLSEQIFHYSTDIASSEFIPESISIEIIKTGEEWIRNIKLIYSRINTENRNFQEEKLYWYSLEEDLKNISAFSISDEFRFLFESLKKIGKLSIAYTLQSLVSDTKVFNLCRRFNEFYSQLNCYFIPNISIERITSSNFSTHSYVDDKIISGSIQLIGQLTNLKKLPRVIRRSLSNNMTIFREEILKSVIVNFTPKFLDVFTTFSNFADEFNDINERDSSDSRVSIEKVESLREYIIDLKQIHKGFVLINITENDHKDLQELINSLITQFKMRIFNREYMFKDNLLKFEDFKYQFVDIETHSSVVKVLNKYIFSFVNTEIKNIKDLCVHLEKYVQLLQFNYFTQSIQKYLEISSKIFFDEIKNLKFSDTNSIVYSESLPENLIIEDFRTISKIEEIISDYRTVSQYFDSFRLLNSQIKHIGMVEEMYFKTLPKNLKDTFIFQNENENIVGKECIECIQSLEIDKPITTAKITIIKVMCLDDTNFILQAKVPQLVEDIKWIKPRHMALSQIINDYLILNTGMGNSEFPAFTSEKFENSIRKLFNLKWKYFEDSYLEDIMLEFTKIQEKHLLFLKILNEISQTIVPSLIKEDRELSMSGIFSKINSCNTELLDLISHHGISQIINGIAEYLIVLISNRDLRFFVELETSNAFDECESFNVFKLPQMSFPNTSCLNSITCDQVFNKIFEKYTISSEFEEIRNHSELNDNIKKNIDRLVEILNLNYFLFTDDNLLNNTDSSFLIKIQEINHLYSQKQRQDEIHNLTLFELHIGNQKIDFDWLISEHLKHLVDSASIFREELINQISSFCFSFECQSFLDRFFNHKKLIDIGNHLKNCIKEIAKISGSILGSNFKDEHDFLNFLIEKSNTNIFDLSERKILVEFISKYLPSEFIVLKNLINFKLENTLSQPDFKQLKELRDQYEDKISQLYRKYEDFDEEESTFLAFFNSYSTTVQNLLQEIENLNSVLSFYKFQPLSFTIDLKNIEIEYNCFIDKKQYIEHHYRLPTKNNPISLLNLDFPQILRTKIAKKLKSEIQNLQLPVSYIPELSKDYVVSEFFDSSIFLKEYISSFDESKTKEIIEKSKCHFKVTEYLKKNKDLLPFVVQMIKFPVITNLDQCLQHVEILQSEFNVVISFNKYRMFYDELKSVELKLQNENILMTKLKGTQETVLDLVKIFNSDQMDLEKANFLRVKELFTQLLSKLDKKDEIRSELIGKCDKIQKISVEIMKSIKSSLSYLREECNRLYFISNDDLILAMRDKLYVLDLLKKIFNISSVHIENNKIIGITGTTESFPLKFSIALDKPIHKIVNDFYISLRISLIENFIYKILDDLKDSNFESIKEIQSFINKINEYECNPKYSVAAVEISIVSDLVAEFKYFNNLSDFKTYKIEKLEEYTKHHREYLDIYPKPILNRFKNAINLQIFKNFTNKNLITESSNDLIGSEKSNIISFLKLDDFDYEFEYYPPTNFIFTSLTAKIFANIILSKNKSGIILYGPSGTGKTESVKYFCKTIGKPLFVFCCNERCDTDSIKNIIQGCLISRNFVCFDEFNRLREEVMSAVTELLFKYKDEIKVFLTMNLGYKGRSELPKSLKYIFGEVFVSDPDIKDIIKYHTKDLKIYDLLQSLKSSCSKDPTYDFGLRAIRHIFNDSFISDHQIPSNILNLVFFYMATFNFKDKQVLTYKLKEIVGVDITHMQESFSLENIFLSAVHSNNAILILGEYGKTSLVTKMIDKCFKKPTLELSDNDQFKDMNRDKSSTTQVFRYNPTNLLLSNDSIFGSFNKVTQEWENSIFLSDLRRRLIKSEETWFVFDGLIKSKWIEDFNSLFDDNRTICLPSGERIIVPFCFKFIFETKNISEATPATLTRMYLIKIEGDNHIQNLSQERFSLPSNDRDSEQSENIDLDLLSNQYKSLLQLRNALESTNTVIFESSYGSGKKKVVRRINSDFSILYSNNLLDFEGTNTLLCIENFENASESLKEQIREFWEFGTVANIKLPNLKIICCADDHVIDLVRIPRVFMGKFKDIELIINLELKKLSWRTLLNEDDLNIVSNFIIFIFKILGLSIDSLYRYLTILDYPFTQEHIFISDFIYFTFEILFGSNTPCRKYLEKLSGSCINELLFDFKNGFKKGKNTNLFEITKSKISFLLYKNMNITIKGSRMSGKRTLINQCICEAKEHPEFNQKEIKILSWDAPEKLEKLNYRLDNQIIYIFILLDEYYPLKQKFLKENTIEIEFKILNPALDVNKLYSDDSLISSLNIKDNLNEKQFLKCQDLKTSTQVELSKNYDCVLLDSIQKLPSYIKFENFFKASCFYFNFKMINRLFKDNYEKRVKFLAEGSNAIKNFENSAESLKKSIQDQRELFNIRRAKLEEAAVELAREKAILEKLDGVLKSDQKGVECDVRIFNEKREYIENTLATGEKTLQESQRCISELSKSQLSEIKSMTNPPEVFRKTIEFTYYLLEDTRERQEWSFLQSYLRKDNFMSKILEFEVKPNQITDFISTNFLSIYKLENSIKISKTCYALHNWLDSIIKHNNLLKEIIPLRLELELLKEKLDLSNDELKKKQHEISAILQKTNEIESNKHIIEIENLEIEQKISNLENQLKVLEKVILNFQSEREKWKFIEFKSPINYLLDSDNSIEFLKEIFIDRNTFMSDAFLPLRKSYIEISMSSSSFKSAVNNTIFFKNDILIKDVDHFDTTIYSLLKYINGRFSIQTNLDTYKFNDYPKVILQGNFSNPFNSETFKVKINPKFSIDRKSNLEVLENGLLNLLNSENCNLESILEHQIQLSEERRMLAEEENLRKFYSVLNVVYDQINDFSIMEYGVNLLFEIFKEVVQNLNLNPENIAFENILKFFQFSFKNKLIIDFHNNFTLSNVTDTSLFNISEINDFSFDYTFITDFNNIYFEIQKNIKIDFEISSGSSENNSKILSLLSEKSDKTILVKNIQFLPTCIKSGTNRFIFTISKNDVHPLMNSTRVVYLDKNSTFDIIFKNLIELLSINSTLNENQLRLVKFHSLGISCSLEFTIRDLEICIDNSELGFNFLVETIYFSKLPKNDQKLLKDKFSEIK